MVKDEEKKNIKIILHYKIASQNYLLISKIITYKIKSLEINEIMI